MLDVFEKLFAILAMTAMVWDCSSFSLPSFQFTSKLKRFNLPKLRTVDMFFEELQTDNSYIFEFKKGCRVEGDELLLMDSKSWKFSEQDTSLEIDFPDKANSTSQFEYLITKFRVYICQDTSNSDGYLTYGGPGQDMMGLAFTSTGTKYLSYDLRVYGINKAYLTNVTEIIQTISAEENEENVL